MQTPASRSSLRTRRRGTNARSTRGAQAFAACFRGALVLFPVLSTPRFTVLVSHACLTHPLPATSNVAHIGRDDGKPPGAKDGKQYTRWIKPQDRLPGARPQLDPTLIRASQNVVTPKPAKSRISIAMPWTVSMT